MCFGVTKSNSLRLPPPTSLSLLLWPTNPISLMHFCEEQSQILPVLHCEASRHGAGNRQREQHEHSRQRPSERGSPSSDLGASLQTDCCCAVCTFFKSTAAPPTTTTATETESARNFKGNKAEDGLTEGRSVGREEAAGKAEAGGRTEEGANGAMHSHSPPPAESERERASERAGEA